LKNVPALIGLTVLALNKFLIVAFGDAIQCAATRATTLATTNDRAWLGRSNLAYLLRSNRTGFSISGLSNLAQHHAGGKPACTPGSLSYPRLFTLIRRVISISPRIFLWSSQPSKSDLTTRKSIGPPILCHLASEIFTVSVLARAGSG
jgi:hypothetical protein